MAKSDITVLQQSLVDKIKNTLEERGVVAVVTDIGESVAVMQIKFDDFYIHVYDDGSAEIQSLKKLDRILGVIPTKIDWRYEIAQYKKSDVLEAEFFKGLREVLDMRSKGLPG